MNRLALAGRLTGEYGQSLEIPAWWREAFAALDNLAIKELLLWRPRQSGKSQCLAAMAITELLLRPSAHVVMASASEKQAGAIYDRKIKKPLERMLQRLGVTARWRKHITTTKRGIELSTGATLEVIATNEATSPGRSPTLLLLDEARAIPDEFYAAFAPSAIGAGGKVVIASTAGLPRGFFYELVQHPFEETWLHHATTNDNPHADRRMMNFLQRRLSVIMPAAARRELGNEFTDDGSEFLPAALIEAAVDKALGEIQESEAPAFVMYDLSRKRDLTSRTVVILTPPQRPEARDHLVVASIREWDPSRSPTGETDFEDVRADLETLPRRFPNLCAVLIDEGAEAGALLPCARTNQHLALVTTGFIGTPATNMKLWGALAARLHARTLTIPWHERLIAELRGLRQEQFAFGSKWRVVDNSRKFHRDVSLTLAGACSAAEEASALVLAPDASDELSGGIPVEEISGNFLDWDLFR
jgi:terminase large subunit-like protein